MTLSAFRKAGHTPTLLASFLYFDVSFMVWVMLGPLGPFIGDALKLTATQKGFLIALPLLAGSFFRPIMGLLADRIGGRRTGLIGLTLTLIPLILGWQFAGTLTHFHLIGLMLGVAGASFAVALPLASRWYPPEYQGMAMGIAGAGNSGTLLATLFAPRLATALGFHGVFAIALIPVCLVMVAFALCGGLAALGGVLLAGYAGKAAQSMGDAYLLPAIAAVVLGGTSILGGRGSYLGTVAGVILITLLQSILSVMQMPEAGRQIIYGVVIVAMLLLYGRSPASRS